MTVAHYSPDNVNCIQLIFANLLVPHPNKQTKNHIRFGVVEGHTEKPQLLVDETSRQTLTHTLGLCHGNGDTFLLLAGKLATINKLVSPFHQLEQQSMSLGTLSIAIVYFNNSLLLNVEMVI